MTVPVAVRARLSHGLRREVDPVPRRSTQPPLTQLSCGQVCAHGCVVLFRGGGHYTRCTSLRLSFLLHNSCRFCYPKEYGICICICHILAYFGGALLSARLAHAASESARIVAHVALAVAADVRDVEPARIASSYSVADGDEHRQSRERRMAAAAGR